ncbi:MAG: hypothetical protein ACTSYW_00370 [Candidatus Heimdallarchaeota archaeon]
MDKYLETLEEKLLVPDLIEGKYRYLDINSYLESDNVYYNRSDTDSELKQESGTYIKDGDDDSDYAESVTLHEISEDYPHKVTFSINPKLASHWTHKTIWRTGNFLNGENSSNRFVWCADVPFAQMAYLEDVTPLDEEEKMFKINVSGDTIDETAEGNYLYSGHGSTKNGTNIISWYIHKVIEGINDASEVIHILYAERIKKGTATAFCWLGSADIVNRPLKGFVSSQTNGTIKFVLDGDYVDTRFYTADEGVVFYWENGSPCLIKKVLTSLEAEIEYLGLAPDYNTNVNAYLGLMIEPHERVYCDTTTDEKLLGKVISKSELYFLQTRQYLPLPSSKNCVVKDGFIFVEDNNEYKYSSFHKIYRMGYYLDGVQSSNLKYGEILAFSESRNGILIFGVDFVAFLDTGTFQDAGDPDLGEFIPFLYTTSIISEMNGIMPRTNVLSITDSDTKIFMCSDKKIRSINNNQMSENIGADIQRLNLDKLYNQATLGYDTINGLYLWSIENSN